MELKFKVVMIIWASRQREEITPIVACLGREGKQITLMQGVHVEDGRQMSRSRSESQEIQRGERAITKFLPE